MSHDDFAIEPVRGLPGHLPEGERILWQGAPSWRALARRALLVRLSLLWFGGFAAWYAAGAITGGLGIGEALVKTATQGIACAIAVGIIATIAYYQAKTTVFTITNRRVVMRFGLALDLSINLPFKQIEGAALRLFRDGTGDIPLALRGNDRLAYLHLWPNARPWHFSKPQPMLKAVPGAEAVARILAEALRSDLERRDAASSDQPARPEPRPVRLPRPARTPAGLHAAE